MGERAGKRVVKNEILKAIRKISPARFREINEEVTVVESTLSKYLDILREEGKIFPVPGKVIGGENVNLYAAVKSPPKNLKKLIEKLRHEHETVMGEVEKAKEAGDKERLEGLINSNLSSIDMCMSFFFTESLIYALKHYGNEPKKACRIVAETWGLIFRELIIAAVRIGHEDMETSIRYLKGIEEEKIEIFRDWMSKNSNQKE